MPKVGGKPVSSVNHAKRAYTPSAKRLTLEPTLAKVRAGQALDNGEAVAFLRTYVGLDAQERRHTLIDLEKAVAQGSGTPTPELKAWKNATVEECVKLLLGAGPEGVLKQIDQELWEITLQLLSSGEEQSHTFDPAQSQALDAKRQGLFERRRELESLRQELRLLPKSTFFQDTGFHGEVSAELSLWLADGGISAGMHVGQEDLVTHEREKEPFVTAAGSACGARVRGLAGTKHRGLEKGVRLPGVGYTNGDPFFPNKLELGLYVGSVFTASGGTVGVSADAPMPGVPQLFPIVRLGVMGAVQDPRLEPMTDWLDDKMMKVSDKVHQGAEAVKKKLHIGQKKSPQPGDGFEDE